MDDTVAWLPPSHPKATISKCAAILRRELEALLPEIDDKEDGFTEEMDFDLQNAQVCIHQHIYDKYTFCVTGTNSDTY